MPNLTTMKDAAEAVGVTPRTLSNWARDGKITRYRMEGSRAVRVDLDELLALFRPEVDA